MLYILSLVGAVILLFIVPAISTGNKAISLEESVTSAKSNLNKEQNRRINLFTNLVDAVESYNDYEGNTQQKLTEARSNANKGNVDDAKVSLNAVVEKYPDLKSQNNYKDLMQNFTSTENRVADYDEAYNNDVATYNRFVKSVPAKWYLNLSGYDVKHYNKSSYTVDAKSAQNLFRN